MWARVSCLKHAPSSMRLGVFNTQTRSVLGKMPRFSTQASRILSRLPQRSARCWTQKTVLGAFPFRKQVLDQRFFSSSRGTSDASATLEAGAAEVASEHTEGLPVLSPPSVGIWLLVSSVLVFTVVVVGGVTRLTESGLSITEWKPVSGILPPLTQADWEEEFEKYKLTPEYKLCVHLFSEICISSNEPS